MDKQNFERFYFFFFGFSMSLLHLYNMKYAVATREGGSGDKEVVPSYLS